MTIDMSPMSTFLTLALFIVGIPGVILSLYVWMRISRRFFEDGDYNLEMLPDSEKIEAKAAGQSRSSGEQADKDNDNKKVQAHPGRDALGERMIHSG